MQSHPRFPLDEKPQLRQTFPASNPSGPFERL